MEFQNVLGWKGPHSPSSSTPGTGHSPGCSFSSVVVAVTDQELFPSGTFSIHFLVPLIFLAAKSRMIFALSVGSEEEEGAAGEGELRKGEQRRSQWICSNSLDMMLCSACRFLDRWKWNLPGAGGWSWVFLNVPQPKPCCESMEWHPPTPRECSFCFSRVTFPHLGLICAGCVCDTGAAPCHSSGSSPLGHAGILGTGSASAWHQPGLLTDFQKSENSSRLQICPGGFPHRSITVTMSWCRTSGSWKILQAVFVYKSQFQLFPAQCSSASPGVEVWHTQCWVQQEFLYTF